MFINLANERIFLAGHTGMVGSSILRKLKNHIKNFDKDNIIFSPHRKELDLLDKQAVEKWFKNNKPSIVIIAAAKVGGILANNSYPASFLLENIKIQTNIIESAWSNNIKRLLFLGSSCIYPKFSVQPIKEDYLLKGELEKTNQWYAIAKIAGIKLCDSLRIQYGFDSISLMPTNLYGPNDNYHPSNSHVMAALIKRFGHAKQNLTNSITCWGTGTPLREFMHVDDLANAVIYVLENWNPEDKDSPKDDNGEKLFYLNVGTGIDISIKDLAKKIAKIYKYDGDILWDKSKPDGTPKKQLDISRIKLLGWEPKIDLDNGLKDTIMDFKKHHLNK
tara:strand:- start:1830 stop:2828 length:999 start_codon:yes stop_codon:yes gene_type:complete